MAAGLDAQCFCHSVDEKLLRHLHPKHLLQPLTVVQMRRPKAQALEKADAHAANAAAQKECHLPIEGRVGVAGSAKIYQRLDNRLFQCQPGFFEGVAVPVDVPPVPSFFQQLHAGFFKAPLQWCTRNKPPPAACAFGAALQQLVHLAQQS